MAMSARGSAVLGSRDVFAIDNNPPCPILSFEPVRSKRRVRAILLLSAGIVLYFLLFPHPLGRETVARMAWAASVPESWTGLAPFELGGMFGYVSAGGRLIRVERTLFRVAMSASSYVNYSRLGTDWIMRNPDGRRLLSFSGNGYPFLSDDGNRIFIIKTDLTGLRELDGNGNEAWNRDFPALITCASVAGDHLLLGLLDGGLLLLDKRGVPVLEQALPNADRKGEEGSRIPATLGCAAARDGSLLAAISGIDPPFLSVLKRKGSSYAPLDRARLAGDFRRELRMLFSPDARYLAYEDENAAVIFETRGRRYLSLPLDGRIAGINFPGGGRFFALLAREGLRCELRIIAPFSRPIAVERFSARDVFLGGVEDQLLLGVDGRLLRIDVVAL
jgi:hypothetical protein